MAQQEKKKVSKASLIIFFVGIVFAIYFGIALYNDFNEAMEAQRQADIAQQDLDQAKNELAQAQQEYEAALAAETT